MYKLESYALLLIYSFILGSVCGNEASLQNKENKIHNYAVFQESDLSKYILSVNAIQDVHNIVKRDLLGPIIQIPSNNDKISSDISSTVAIQSEEKKPSVKKDGVSNVTIENVETSQASTTKNYTNIKENTSSTTTELPKTVIALNATENQPNKTNVTVTNKEHNVTLPIDINQNTTIIDHDAKNNTKAALDDKSMLNPGATKRALIVFGSLGLFSFAYLIYKIKRKKQRRENAVPFYQNDNQQFKYGVLLSNENDDNMELSNLPLTIDSEDEEMEIFDLEQKKYLENNQSGMYGIKDRLPAKDDVEILDLNLPGTSNRDVMQSTSDDNLLNLDENHLNTTVIDNKITKGSYNTNKNDFFDVL